MIQLSFQSLTWVERLSDLIDSAGAAIGDAGFNPSPGLNVFQTDATYTAGGAMIVFQSLTWVERLSDPKNGAVCENWTPVSIPHLG